MKQQQTKPSSSVWRPRFGLVTLLLVMLVSCFAGTAGYYLARAIGMVGGRGLSVAPQAVFVLFTVAAPALLLLVLSASRGVLAWLDRYHPRIKRPTAREGTAAEDDMD